MGIEIIGGQTKRAADVTFENGLKTLAVHVGPQMYATYKRNVAWTAFTTVTPGGAGNYFFYMGNNDSIRDLLITSIRIDMATTDIIAIRYVTGTPSSTTAVTPVSRAVSLNAPLDAAIYSGTAIGSLTNGGTFERMKILTTETVELNMVERPLMLPRSRPGHGIGFAAITGSIAINIAVDFMTQAVDPQEYAS